MVEYVSRDELISIGRKNLTENRARVLRAAARSPAHNTFLSHSSKDDEVIPVVVEILESHGATVYVDKKDSALGNLNPKEIASSLREKIASTRKFVTFASSNIRDSKWVPWEIGLADGYKRSANVAIFPAPDKAHDFRWTEQEYLGIYDRVVWGCLRGEERHKWLVWNHVANTATTLREWLER